MIGLCRNKTYATMTKYDGGGNNKDNDGNNNGTDDNNAAAGSGSGGPIFDPVTMPWSCLGIT